MNPWLYLIISVIALPLIGLLSLALNMLKFSLAKIRFSGIKENNFKKLEKYILNNSRSAAIILSLAMRACIGAGMLALFFLIESIFLLCAVELNFFGIVAIAALSLALGILFQYSFSDLPASYYANTNPQLSMKKYSKSFAIVFGFIYPIEFLARKISVKIFGKNIEKELDSFNYIDVDVKLRAEDSDVEELNSVEEEILKNTMRMPELEVADIMLPRNQVCCLSLQDDFSINIKKAKESGHTRYPLCNGDLDNCVGLIHIKDIFRAESVNSNDDLIKIKRDIMTVREDASPAKTLSIMRGKKFHIALVEDEFGAINGIITLENILELIVGQINDEFDKVEDTQIKQVGEKTYKVSGLIPLHELSKHLDVELFSEEASTLGGLITQELGRFPTQGEILKIESLEIEVNQVDKKRVILCTIKVEE